MNKPNVAAKADTATKTKKVSATVEKAESTAKPNTTAETAAKAKAVEKGITLEKQPIAETKGKAETTAKPETSAKGEKTEAQKKAEALAIQRKEQKYVIRDNLPLANITGKKTIRAFCFATAKALQDANGSFTLDEWRTALVAHANVAKEKFEVKNLNFTTPEGKPNGRCIQHTTWFASANEQWVVPAKSAEVAE